MERVYDKYRSDQIQGACYKYIHKCVKCGEILFEIPVYRYERETIKIPNYCHKCGTKQ